MTGWRHPRVVQRHIDARLVITRHWLCATPKARATRYSLFLRRGCVSAPLRSMHRPGAARPPPAPAARADGPALPRAATLLPSPLPSLPSPLVIRGPALARVSGQGSIAQAGPWSRPTSRCGQPNPPAPLPAAERLARWHENRLLPAAGRRRCGGRPRRLAGGRHGQPVVGLPLPGGQEVAPGHQVFIGAIPVGFGRPQHVADQRARGVVAHDHHCVLPGCPTPSDRCCRRA